MSESKIIRAVQFAEEAHRGQMREIKGGAGNLKEEHLFHLTRVATLACFQAKEVSDDFVTAAYLHDILKDTSFTSIDLVKIFGIEVANIVSSLTPVYTKKRFPTLSIQARARLEAKQMISARKESQIIKLLHLIDNLRDLEDRPGDNSPRDYALGTMEFVKSIGPIAPALGTQLASAAQGILKQYSSEKLATISE